MQEISIFGILCEINPKNKKIIFGLPKSQSPKVIVDHYCVKLAKMNPMMKKLQKSEPVCGSYDLSKIIDG